MSVASVYTRLDALCHAAQRRSPSRVEIERQKMLLITEVTKLAKEVERSHESITTLRWRNHEHEKAEKELTLTLQQERQERAIEQKLLRKQIEHLQAKCYRERERTVSLASENEQWRLHMNNRKLSSVSSSSPVLLGATVKTRRNDYSDSSLPIKPAARPIYLCSRSNSNTSLSSIRPKPYLRTEIEACSDTSSSILADVPRHAIQLSDIDLKRSMEQQEHSDLDGYFWNRCPHKCSCGMLCEKESSGDTCTEDPNQRPFSNINTERRLCRIPSIEFNELFISTEPNTLANHPMKRGSSVRRRKSLARLVQEILEMQENCQMALDGVNEQIRSNRARVRDTRREVVKMQNIVMNTESRLEVMQQAIHHTDAALASIESERVKEYQHQINDAIANKKAMTEQLQALRKEDLLLREQKKEIENHLEKFQEEIKLFRQSQTN
ncbi:hypothetical protein BDF19DRAFT_441092 [Syncephalis fuscata]|nr:hypothetical protein BDF19DRAFT_441092 [Syncephalis fuscata]